ncbi:MAG TPA: hypothetical protein VL401_01915 [Alphaproteobacteria bacterium]|jgi:hypothetical protein|nr:hypothetical protein [Alphaproteobacteria bacterium]
MKHKGPEFVASILAVIGFSLLVIFLSIGTFGQARPVPTATVTPKPSATVALTTPVVVKGVSGEISMLNTNMTVVLGEKTYINLGITAYIESDVSFILACMYDDGKIARMDNITKEMVGLTKEGVCKGFFKAEFYNKQVDKEPLEIPFTINVIKRGEPQS